MSAPETRERHAHLEEEMRYITPQPIKLPKKLGELKLSKTHPAHTHVDTYYDTDPDNLGGTLRDSGFSLRIRRGEDGSRVITIKEKLPDGPGGETRRREDEEEVPQPLRTADSDTWARALALCGGERPQILYAVSNRRENAIYESKGARVILSCDELIYPDGSRELRVEIELAEGSSEDLRAAARELERKRPELKLARAGKRVEARNRLKGMRKR